MSREDEAVRSGAWGEVAQLKAERDVLRKELERVKASELFWHDKAEQRRAEVDRLREALEQIDATHKKRGYCLWAQDIARTALEPLPERELPDMGQEDVMT